MKNFIWAMLLFERTGRLCEMLSRLRYVSLEFKEEVEFWTLANHNSLPCLSQALYEFWNAAVDKQNRCSEERRS